MSKIEPSKSGITTTQPQTPLTKSITESSESVEPIVPATATKKKEIIQPDLPSVVYKGERDPKKDIYRATEPPQTEEASDMEQIGKWLKENIYRAGEEPPPRPENPTILTKQQRDKLENFLKEEARRRGEAYVSPFKPKEQQKLPDFISSEGLDPNGLTAWLITQYNAETDPEIKKTLYDKIYQPRATESAVVSEELEELEKTQDPDRPPLPPTISAEGLDPTGVAFNLINQYNAETDPVIREQLYEIILTEIQKEEPSFERPEEQPEEPTEEPTEEQPEEPTEQLPETMSIQGLDPDGITAWLITQYNTQTNPDIKKSLFDRITQERQREEEIEKVREQELAQGVKKIVKLGQIEQPEPTSGLTDEDKQEMQKLLAPIEEQVNDDLKPFVSQSEDETTNTQAELQRKRDQKKYAMLSQIAYDVYSTSPEEANAKLKDYMPAHSIILEDTTKNATVIQKINNKGEREITIAYRGTILSNMGDLAADTAIFFGNPAENLGMPTGRFLEAENTYKRIKEKYPDAKITLTGHSLGGRQAILVGEKYNVPTQAFNVGSFVFDFVVPNAEKKDFIKIYNVPSDPISMSSRYDTSQEVIDVPNRGNPINPLSAHALTNFLPERVITGQATEKPTTKIVKQPTIAQSPTAPVELPKEDLIVSVVNFEDTSYQLGPLIDPEKTDEPKRFVYQRIPSSTTQVVNNKPLSSFRMIEIFQSVDKERNCKIDPITLQKTCPERRKEDKLFTS